MRTKTIRAKYAAAVLLALMFSSWLSAAAITGRVQEVSAGAVTIETDGDVVPSVGDKVTIFFNLEDVEVAVGSGQVTEVSGTSIKVKIEQATGEVAKGHLARFDSENPQPRAPPTDRSSPLSSPTSQGEKAPSEAAQYATEGLARMEAKDFKGALLVYNKWIEFDPTNPKPYANRGSIYNALKQPKRGLTDLNESIRLDPTISMTYVIRGNIYADLHQLKRAIQDYDEAIRIDPKNISAYYSRGTVYAELRQLKRAIDDFSQAIVLNPTYKEAYWNRSRCYEATGKAELAKRDFAKFQELNAGANSSPPAKPAPVAPAPKE